MEYAEWQYDEKQKNVDERFMQDWVDYGFTEIESFLLKHARFEAYLGRTSDAGSEED